MGAPKLEKIVKIEAEMVVLTGIKIGGSQDKFDIGGVDNPVIRTSVPVNFLRKVIGFEGNIPDEISQEEFVSIPYIPGSSIKGRMRALLEIKHGAVPENGDVSSEDPFKSVFGVPAKEAGEEFNITRAIFRDAYPTKETIEMWLKNIEETFDLGTELKIENKINRLTGGTAGGGLRKMERVLPGSRFKVEVNLLIFDKDKGEEEKWINLIKEGFKLIEETYLGGCGTRGYGKVKFENIKITHVSPEDFQKEEIKVGG